MRAWFPWTAVALLVTGTLAGCLSDSDGVSKTSNDEEPLSTVVVEPEPGVKIAENRGALRGQVTNDAFLPVAGAAVFLTGTALFTQSAGDGTFLFVNLTAGPYNVRAEKENFNPASLDVEVVRGNVTNASLVLVPLVDRGGGLSAHTHDFWGEKTELVLMDHDVDLSKDIGYQCGAVPFVVCTHAYWGNFNQTGSGGTGWTLPLPESAEGGAPPLVLPGTGEIWITLNWDSTQIMVDKMGIVYIRADSIARNPIWAVPKNTVMKIPVNATTADSGHLHFSLWSFYAHTDNNPQATSSWRGGLVLPGAKLHVKIVLKKADVYLEPEHANYWADGDMIVLREKNPPVKFPDGTFPFVYRSKTFGFTPAKGKIVPPGTGKMRIELTWTYPQGAGPADFDHDLTWRVGNQPPHSTLLKDYHRMNPKETGAGKKVWEFDVKPEWTDVFYQKKSSWIFALWLKPWQEDGYQVDPRPHDVTLEVIVWKDPKYALG